MLLHQKSCPRCEVVNEYYDNSEIDDLFAKEAEIKEFIFKSIKQTVGQQYTTWIPISDYEEWCK